MGSFPLAARAALAVAAVMSASPSAYGYCIGTTCKETCKDPDAATTACDGQLPEGCALKRWPSGCVGFATQKNATDAIADEPLRRMLGAAFAVWQAADCGGGQHPGIAVQDLGEVSCGDVEYNRSVGNANIIVFRDDVWTNPEHPEYIGVTKTSASCEDATFGALVNADMEINSADYDFSPAGFNLQAVLTHEAGHFLGLAHSDNSAATMSPTYNPQADFSTLHPDDVAGICALYPPADIDAATCNPIPKHGFASECKDDQVVGCSVVAAGAAGRMTWLVPFGVILSLSVGARRRRAAPRPREVG